MSGWTCASCDAVNPEGTKFCGHCGHPAADVPAKTESAERDVADALRSFVAGPVAERLVEAGGQFPEERRLVTALFADVSGFTALADRLDPEQLLEVIDPVIAAGLAESTRPHLVSRVRRAGAAVLSSPA
jgi:class 3 adenylate cyclase